VMGRLSSGPPALATWLEPQSADSVIFARGKAG